jgi:hypothetical protein
MICWLFDVVYIYDSETSTYIPYTEEFEILSDLTTESQVSSEIVDVNSSLILKTPALSADDPLEDMIWSIGENMYSFSTMNQLKDTLIVDYAYNYNLKNNFVPLDTVLNPILDDVFECISIGIKSMLSTNQYG